MMQEGSQVSCRCQGGLLPLRGGKLPTDSTKPASDVTAPMSTSEDPVRQLGFVIDALDLQPVASNAPLET